MSYQGRFLQTESKLEDRERKAADALLEIRNLVKVYPGPVAALQGVSLDVGQGMFGLLGPNGAGKTTLMRIVAGLLEPTSGTVHFDGEDIVADPRRIRRQLGYLPQDFGFYPHLAELAEDRTVLLSTHIVDDISVLCPRVAIMTGGRFVADTTPAGARDRLAGTIYQGAVAKEDLAAVDRDYRVTQAILIEGRNQVRIHLPEGPPPDTFEAADPTLEDAYLLLAQANGAQPNGAVGAFAAAWLLFLVFPELLRARRAGVRRI